MKVGLTFYDYPSLHFPLDSIQYVARSLMEAVSTRHEVVFLPPEYVYRSDEDARRMSEEFVRNCDVLVGLPSEPVLAARQRIGSSVPFVCFLLGMLPRGGWALRGAIRHLTTRDVLLANSTADVELAHKFFCNAQVRLVPFAFDERVFYPLDAAERSAARVKHGFGEQDRIVLYAGRVTLEKNVHTLLRIFGTVQELVPDACLVIAGPTLGLDFAEFGVIPLNLENTIRKLIVRLGIPEGRVRMIGHTDSGRLRELYNIADVKANLSLHHDENFGLAQVEAMACGAPVVGTAWGGLRDTIVDGTSGYRVSTVPTPLGVKVNWWEAVNRIVDILQDPRARERLRVTCARHAVERYPQSSYEATLNGIISASTERGERAPEALRATGFAEEFWSVCNPYEGACAPYRRGPRATELYQELMGPFTGASPKHVPAGEECTPGQVLCLAAPVTEAGQGRFRLDDPLYPLMFEVPQAHLGAFRAILAAMHVEPTMTIKRLSHAHPDRFPDALDTLDWMLSRGLLLRSVSVRGWVPPEEIGRSMSEPLFRIEHLDRMDTDFVVY
jgi:glycosyltransferase involved in cell wall biosynthesis